MTTTLDQIITVRGRFHRSVNVVADWGEPNTSASYLVTHTVRELASSILEELCTDSGARAWSITGPYGSGKSAFALFLCDILANGQPSHNVGRALRARFRLGSRRFLPVLTTAERGPLGPRILEALANGAAGRPGRAKGTATDGEQVIAALEESAHRARLRRRSGLLVVVDELGKYLEYAALRPDEADVFLLQQLAETASRSPVPIVLLTVLHSGFADYLPATEEVRRSEWQKVQGRFHDVPFQLPFEQVLQLVAAAIERKVPPKLEREWRGLVKENLGFLRAELKWGSDLQSTLEGCLPLHPLTALLLWPLFRSKGAQNERSLFAFLTSREPHGLRDFLASVAVDGSPEVYRPARLYDYVTTCLGLNAFRGDQARRWSLADQAIARLEGNAPAVSADLIKTVALVSLYGAQIGLRPTPQVVASAIGDRTAVDEACRYLERNSVLVFRKHAGGYALWEGSDFDLDAAYEKAVLRVRGSGTLAERLRRVIDLRPHVARAHYVKTGTMRLFRTALVSEVGDLAIRDETEPEYDGTVAFLLPASDALASQSPLQDVRAVAATSPRPIVLAFPRDLSGLAEALSDLEAWHWVAKYSLELAGDPVARQEVRARVLASQQRLEAKLGPVLGVAGYTIDPALCSWEYGRKVLSLTSAVHFQRWLSEVCARVYHRSPVFRNELLNRSVLSSAAAAARRALIQRVLEQGRQERLGLDGWPPEASMYDAMMHASGMHLPSELGYAFGPPSGGWLPAWQEAEAFITGATASRRSLKELFAILKAPPYGLKDGPLPVLFCVVLLYLGDDAAIYEDGVFVPALRIEVFERLLRRPESFEVRSHALTGAQMKVVRALGKALRTFESKPTRSDPHSGKPVAIVRELVVAAAGLPAYSRQTRRRLSPEAVRVREQLLAAADPTKLLFEDLPTACGVELSSSTVDAFVEVLVRCMAELSDAYEALLDEVETMVRSAFDLSPEQALAERQLRQLAEPLVPFATDPRLQVFLREAAREPGGRDWRESLARAVNDGLPAKVWKDSDVAAFQVRLAELRGEVVRLEELAAEMRRSGAPRVVRFGLLEPESSEVREVVPLRGGSDAEVDALVTSVSKALWQHSEDSADARRVRLEALARVAADLLIDVRREVPS